MNFIKERLIGAITVMSVEEAEKLWNMILSDYSDIEWESIGDVEPTEEETSIFKAYKSGDEEYQTTISHNELKKELNI